MDADLANHVRYLANQMNCSTFVVLLAAFRMVLTKYTGQQDFAIGAAYQVRPPNMEKTLGYFVNTLPVRHDVKEVDTIEELITKEKDTMLEAMEHGVLPFQSIITAAGVNRSASYNPLVQTMIVYQDESFTEATVFDGVQEMHALIDLYPKVSHMDLTLVFNPVEACFQCVAQYNTDVFQQDTIQWILDSYLLTLRTFVRDRSLSLKSVDVLSSEQKQWLLLLHQGEIRPEYFEKGTLLSRFISHACNNPHDICLLSDDGEMSYEQVDVSSSYVARYLRENGVKPGDYVGIFLEGSFEIPVFLIGIWKAGCVYVPCDPSYPMERLSMYLEDCECPYLLTLSKYSDHANMVVANVPRTSIMILQDALVMAGFKIEKSFEAHPQMEDIAYVR
jgi:non-ribosomal peptide synthetase component F